MAMIRIAQPYIGAEERAAVMAVLESGHLVSGPLTRQLEETFARDVAGTSHAVAVAKELLGQVAGFAHFPCCRVRPLRDGPAFQSVAKTVRSRTTPQVHDAEPHRPLPRWLPFPPGIRGKADAPCNKFPG